MSANAWAQLGLFLAVLLAAVKPLGWYMARVFQGQPCGLDHVLGWLERGLYRLAGVDLAKEMTWRVYAGCVLFFNGVGLVFLYVLLRLQAELPLNQNPEEFKAVEPGLAFNTAVSFATNTNWQSYGGESTLSYLSQMLGLGVQNFLSAATGIAVLIALVRGLARHSAETIGNFWVDLVRATLYVLMPMSLLLAVLLVSQGVVQNFDKYQEVTLLQPLTVDVAKKDADGKAILDADGKPVTEKKEVATQTLPMGPAASQIAIKQLGTNGGGFFNANGAHPYENPTPLSNFFELMAILIIPARSATPSASWSTIAGRAGRSWPRCW